MAQAHYSWGLNTICRKMKRYAKLLATYTSHQIQTKIARQKLGQHRKERHPRIESLPQHHPKHLPTLWLGSDRPLPIYWTRKLGYINYDILYSLCWKYIILILWYQKIYLCSVCLSTYENKRHRLAYRGNTETQVLRRDVHWLFFSKVKLKSNCDPFFTVHFYQNRINTAKRCLHAYFH